MQKCSPGIFIVLFSHTMKYLMITLICCIAYPGFGQSLYGLTDGRTSTYACGDCIRMLNEKPREVLFGIHINNDNEVFFSMSSRYWFDKLFTGSEDGVTTDVVAKDQFECGQTAPRNKIPLGHLFKPVYRTEMLQQLQDLPLGQVMVKIGTLPNHLHVKELEGNLVLIRNGIICFYTSFTSIDRRLWGLLDMGLYTDSLVNNTHFEQEDKNTIYTQTYQHKYRFIIPFRAADAQFDRDSMAAMFRQLQLSGQKIKSINIRAYSSVEGSAAYNSQLRKQRAALIMKAIQQRIPQKIPLYISTHANWIGFEDDLRNTPYQYLTRMKPPQVEKALQDQPLLLQLEKYFARHRKAIITVLTDQKKAVPLMPDDSMPKMFTRALQQNELKTAHALLQDIYERIADNSLPDSFINRLEIPAERQWAGLAATATTYKYLLRISGTEEALEQLLRIRKLDSTNGRLNYNIAALTLRQWKQDTGYIRPERLHRQLLQLRYQRIPSSLIERMLINYHILLCEYHTAKSQYRAKDSALSFIRDHYQPLRLDDPGLVSLAKYFAYYGQFEWAMQVLEGRTTQPDVTEDLLFYFVTLHLIGGTNTITEKLRHAISNALTLNTPRFCALFNSVNTGGSSFQLLVQDQWKAIYCDRCK